MFLMATVLHNRHYQVSAESGAYQYGARARCEETFCFPSTRAVIRELRWTRASIWLASAIPIQAACTINQIPGQQGAKAGIHPDWKWIPAFAGMTNASL